MDSSTIKIKLKLFADYYQFYIQDENVDGDLSEKWTDDAVNNLLATNDGTIGIGTVRNMDVPITINIFSNKPDFLIDEENIINQINECDLEITSGRIVIAGCTDYFPDAKRLELDTGIYRVRIYYCNLDKISEDGLDGDDFYEIHLWKTDKKGVTEIIQYRHANK